MRRFDDQTVLVTGGTGGQGSSHVRAFHAEGANVVIGGLDPDRGAAVDLTDESSWSAAVRAPKTPSAA